MEHPDNPPKKPKQRGGKREGAGRPRGSTNALPLGTVAALKALRLRVPEGAAPEVAEVAGRCLERVADVLEGKVHFTDAGHVLKAAAMLREELCGPIAQKLQHTGADGAPLSFELVRRERKREN